MCVWVSTVSAVCVWVSIVSAVCVWVSTVSAVCVWVSRVSAVCVWVSRVSAVCVFKSNQAGGAGWSFDRPSLLWQNSLLISQSLQKGIEKESKTQHLNAESKMPTLTQVCCELFSGESLVLMGVLL